MKTKNVMQKLLVLLILTLAGSNIAQAVTYTFHIVNKSDGTDIVTGTWDRLDLPSEIKSPMCDFRYYNSAINAKNDDGTTGLITSAPGSDTDIYVAYTINSAYEKYFSTAGNEHWYYAHCNGYYVHANQSDVGAKANDDNATTTSFNKYTDESFMWALVGDPYQANLCVKTHGLNEPLVRTSDDATTLRFSSTVTDKKFIVLDAGSGGFSFRYATEASGGNGDFINRGNPFVIWKTSLSSGRTNSGNKWTFVDLVVPINVTYHLVNSTGTEGFSVITQTTSGSAPDLPNRNKLARLNCTIGTTYYSDAACTTTISSITESTADVYVQYTFDAATLKNNTNIEFSTDYDHAKWMTLRFNNDNTKYLQYNSNPSVANIKKESTTPSDDSYEFAFIGDPFKFRIVNKAAGSSMDAKNTNDNTTTTKQLSFTSGTDSDLWALVAPTTGTSMFQIMLASTYADNASFYWNNANPVILYQKNNDTSNNMLATLVASAPTVEFTQTSYTTDKNTNVTITANATLNGGTAITYTAIQRKNADGTYTQVATANAATVSYTVDASEYGNYTYRAVAVPDGRSELIGTSDDVTVTVQYPTVSGGPFTLKLVDKSGNVLFTQENVTGTDVQNSFGDPLPAEWRSPMVTQYKYYTDQGQTNAKDADNTNLLDWTNSPTSTVYVGYDVGDALDLNSSSFSDFNSLMTTRVPRNGDANMQVRNADSFGKMYMLKFKTSADFNYYAENTKDGVSTTLTTGGSYVYPYTNGDGPIYVYPDKTYQDTRDDGASTRTRYPWFLVSPNNDPYHVYITSWQTSHNQKSGDVQTNYYSYLRTYYNNAISPAQIVTNNVTDDPATKDGDTQILPTEYMLLAGNGTDGAYKLMTVDPISDGTTTERRTVTSLEQYWRTYPTAQNVTDKSAWHQYSHYVNAKPTKDGKKVYENVSHWFQTIELGDGSLDIVETNIDGVLVLLDNHGWEIMRHPIVQHTAPDYNGVKEALKKYDSPMVATYKFYATRTVDHKVLGYHKYNINNGTSKALDERDREGANRVFTSLADYPVTMENGAMADLYVTYDVKEEYKANYAGAATEDAVTKSAVNLRQGGKYANANGTTIEDATSASGNTSKWYLKPNFNIDKEMGYQYDVDVNGLKDGTHHLTEAETNAAYHAHGQSGFDPYNIQIQNVADETKYFTTNASSATLDAGKWSGDGATVSLADVQSRITPTGYDQTTLAVTNNTFMAVQDANGNMRLMPRFDHGHVVDNFTTLETPAAAQAAGDASHAQTTKLSVGSITYKVIDNSGKEVFSETVTDGAGISLPRRLESPFVEKYTFHSTLELAKGATRGITSDVTGSNIPSGGIVYVGYKVKDNFGNGNYWNIFGAGTNGLYVHPVYQSNTKGKANILWWKMAQMQRDYDGWSKTINTSNFPFLDNGYAWEFAGENPDPYNALLFNKGAKMYIKHYSNDKASNARTTDFLTPDATDADLDRYAFVYFDNNEESDDLAMYNRHKNSSNVDDGGFVTFDNNNKYLIANRDMSNRSTAQRFVVTQLPQITINVVNSGHVVEVSLQGYYKSGASWTNSATGTVDNTPFYLDRAFAQGHTFYYDQQCTDVISGEVSDSKVLANGSVFVSYTLANDWGAVSEENPDYGTTFRPADNDYLYWYVIRPQGENSWHFKASTTGTPSEITGTNNYTFTNENINDEASRLTQWTFRGTPYNLKIVDRYHGESSWVGVSKTAVAGDKAKVYDTYNPEQITTTWELTRSLTGNTPYLYIRPQRSLEGSSPLLYLSYEYSKNCLADFLKGVELKFVKKTPANTVTFKIQKGHDDIDMTTYGIADYTATGVPEGQSLSSVFSHSPQLRRYCEYKFYSDAACTTELTKTGNEKNQVVYVKWEYTDDAPVFSQTGWDERDYQYYMLGVWGFNNYNLMDVEGEGTNDSPYTFKPNSDVGTPRDLKHQFAVVGNPYGFKLYNRAAGKDIRRNNALEITFADKEADGTTDTEEITFDLPIVSGRAYTSTETHFRSTTTGRYLSVTGTNESRSFSMTDNAGGNTRFRYLIVPLHVFYEENTTLAAQKDYRMYGLELNPNNTARQTSDRFNTDAMRASDNKIGLAFDFNHAFCDYTFYRSYDWTTGALSDAIPEGGLSYYGGKIQTKRQFFATYTVDWDQFGKLYLIAQPANDYPGDETQAKPFLGKGNKSADVDGYWLTKSDNTVTDIRADNQGTYRFKFIGDPYDMQIINIGTKDDDMVLGAKCTTYVGTNDIEQGLMTLNKNEKYSKMSHFEIIQRSNGNHVFYLLDDENGRFFSSLHPSNNNIQNLIAYTINDEAQTLSVQNQMNRIKEFLIIPAIPQHSVTWNIVDDNHQIIAKEVVANAEEGTEFTLDDLPETLKRHYCDYNNMYSDQDCNTQYTGNKVTLGSEGITIYVPYTLDSGAPEFSTSIEGDQTWHEIGFPHFGAYVYYDDTAVLKNVSGSPTQLMTDIREGKSDMPWDYFRWSLIGTPYGVWFYNKQAKKYLYIDASGNLTLNESSGTTFDLMDDWQEDLCAIYDETSKLYVGRSTNNVVATEYNNSATSVEFSSDNGVTSLYLILHYSNETQRLDDWDPQTRLNENNTQKIDIPSFQKKGKELIEVLPEYWKRAFCNYSFHWDKSANESSYNTSAESITTITQEMVDAFKGDKANNIDSLDIYIHVTYEVQSPFEWSTETKDYTDKHWYYLVNNHIQGTEQGKLVFRSTDPILRVSDGLVDNRLYLSNYEWCVIGDPYGFKLLNRYDPDQRYDEYISISSARDNNNEGKRLEQVAGSQMCVYEMMPGKNTSSFWIHPLYENDEFYSWTIYDTTEKYSYVGNNYNGSNAIISDNKRPHKYLRTNGAANFRLEIQSDKTLAEYVKYAGFVGGLKYDKVTEEIRTDVATDGELSDENKLAVHALIDDPDNIVQMEQGYYRIIPYAQESGTSHNYVTGYHDIREIAGATGITWNMKVVSQEAAEYDPATIFWFEGTTEDETNYPRYFVRTQGLYLQQNRLKDTGSPYKVRYEDLGAAITQLKVDNATGTRPSNYLSVSGPSATETTINQCFDEQAGVYKTRFYLQKVGEANKSEMGFKAKLMDMKDGYSYVSLYVPFDVDIDKGVAFIGKQEYANSKSGQDIEGTSWKEAPYKLRCYSVNDQTGKTQRYIPAGTPVLIRVATNEANVEHNNSTYTDALYVKANVSTIQGENGEIINAPSAAVSSEVNKFRGQYLAQVLPLQNNEVVYVHGLSSKYGPGFFKNGNTYEGVKNNAYVKNNKLYYTSIVSSGAKSFGMAMFVDGIEDFSGSTTGIQSISSDQDIDWENAEVYDLQGRRVRVPQRGIYIVNGKKVVIK